MKFLLFLLICLPLSYSVTAGVIKVNRNGNFSTIKSAIAAAEKGDTILVSPGIYREGNILVNKSISLMGQNYPVLDGEMKFEILTVTVSNVNIEGFKIINSGRGSIEDVSGINCLNAHFVKIRNNQLENTFFGIHLSNTNYSLIINNKLVASAEHEYELGNGIHLWQCKNASIIGNTIKGHRDGIYFEFVTQSTIIKNTSEGNMRYGLHFMFSNHDTYEYNIFRNNGAGVAVMYSTYVTMKKNSFDRNWGASAYGLLLKDIRDSEVINNTFHGNTSGIYMEGSSRTVFRKNIFSSNGWAIKLQASCDNNTFTENNFIGNTFDIATNSDLVLNLIDDNYWDKYEGYDMNKDGTGDIPYYPVNLYSMIVETVPSAMLLWRSFLVLLLDNAERVIPAITPENMKDENPVMKPYDQY